MTPVLLRRGMRRRPRALLLLLLLLLLRPLPRAAARENRTDAAKTVYVHACPKCCEPPNILAFRPRGPDQGVRGMDLGAARKALAKAANWVCVNPGGGGGRRRRLDADRARPPTKDPPTKDPPTKDPPTKDPPTQDPPPAALRSNSNTSSDRGDPRCAAEGAFHFHKCAELILDRVLCSWIPPKHGKRGRCVPRADPTAPDADLPWEAPPDSDAPEAACKLFGLDCNAASEGGKCVSMPSNGELPAPPVCAYKVESANEILITSFDCWNRTDCKQRARDRKKPPPPKGYCSPTAERHGKCTQADRHRDGGVARAALQAAPASCAASVCTFERETYGAAHRSRFCGHVQSGQLSHRQMRKFCHEAKQVQEANWTSGDLAAAECSQCDDYCSRSAVTNVTNAFRDTCLSNSDLADSPRCPPGMAHASGRCFFLDLAFRTRAQADRGEGICRRVARRVYGVSAEADADRSAVRPAVLDTEALQCVSVALLSQQRGTTHRRGAAPWCHVTPYEFVTARAWIGLRVTLGVSGGPQWDDGTPFVWNNFPDNAAFAANDTKALAGQHDSGAPLDVFASAGLEIGAWYASDPASRLRAYTMCQFPDTLSWTAPTDLPDPDADYCDGGADARTHAVLTLRITIPGALSNSSMANVTEALGASLAAHLNASSESVVLLRRTCDASAGGRRLREGYGLDGHGRRLVGEGVADYSFAVPATVTQADVDDLDFDEVSAAATEQAYTQTQDIDVVDAAPVIESATVVASGAPPAPDDDDDDDAGGSTDDIADNTWIIVGGVAGAMAMSVLAIGLMIKFKQDGRGTKRKRGLVDDDALSGGGAGGRTPSPRPYASDSGGSDPELSAATRSPIPGDGAGSYTPDTDMHAATVGQSAAAAGSSAAQPSANKRPRVQGGRTGSTASQPHPRSQPSLTAKSIVSIELAPAGRDQPYSSFGSLDGISAPPGGGLDHLGTSFPRSIGSFDSDGEGSWVGSVDEGSLLGGDDGNGFGFDDNLDTLLAMDGLQPPPPGDEEGMGALGLDMPAPSPLRPGQLAPQSALEREHAAAVTAAAAAKRASSHAVLNPLTQAGAGAVAAAGAGALHALGPIQVPVPSGVVLPEGWLAAKDPTTGRVYYANVATGASSWTVPGKKPERGSLDAMAASVAHPDDDQGGAAAASPAKKPNKARKSNKAKKSDGGSRKIRNPSTSSTGSVEDDPRAKAKAVASRRKGRKWTPEEDAYVVACVKRQGTSKWKEMGEAIGRTGAQCSQRYRKVLDPTVKRFVKWTAEEDAKLIAIHAEHPEWTNKQIAAEMPGRTPTQCHNRWWDKVNPELRWGNWTPEEDAAIWNGREEGFSWSKIVPMHPCLHHRANVAIKNRWHSLKLAREKAAAKAAAAKAGTAAKVKK